MEVAVMTLFPESSHQESGLHADAMAARQRSLAEKATTPRAAVALSALSSVNWIRRLFWRMRRLIDSQAKQRRETFSLTHSSHFEENR
jgi:hypothetical protein